MEFKKNIKKKRYLNLTPLIDVIFLLVVFFLLTTEFITTTEINLNVLSNVEKDESLVKSEKKQVVIRLIEGKKFTFNQKEYPVSDLSGLIKNLEENKKIDNLILIAKQGVIVQELVDALDVIKQNDHINISLLKEE